MDNKNITYGLRLPILILTGLAAIGCSSTSTEIQKPNSGATLAELKERESQLKQREIALQRQIAQQQKEQNKQDKEKTVDNSLLPPKAKAGECYVRIWKEPTYKTVTEQVLVSDEHEEITTTPAQYQTVNEKVLVSEATSQKVIIPAVHKNVQEKILVSKADRSWRVNPYPSAALASDEVVERARQHGIDTDNAEPNMCFHEHLIAAKYDPVKKPIIIKEAYEKELTTPATYKTVAKQVLVKEASSKIITIPAEYETVEEQVLDKPAHQIWKKGKGAIQKIDESTGEIMCLVDVPATYKTVYKKVLKSPATTKSIKVPAQYKTVMVKEIDTPETVKRITVPAEYSYVTKDKITSEEKLVWHEINTKHLTKKTRTGYQICLVDIPAEYTTVEKQVLVAPVSYKSVETPAKYSTIQVQKLVQEARVNKKVIPAQHKTVERKELVKEGKMEWRSILCETNMTTNRIADIQQALLERGYNPGPIDGIVGKKTMAAVNAFQNDNQLPVDKYLNIETVNALNVPVN